MSLQTFMEFKGRIVTKKCAASVSEDHYTKHKASLFPIDDMLKRRILNQDLFTTAVLYRFIFDKIYRRSTASWKTELTSSVSGAIGYYAVSKECEKSFRLLQKSVGDKSKKLLSILDDVVLYDRPLYDGYAAYIVQGLKIMQQQIARLECSKWT